MTLTDWRAAWGNETLTLSISHTRTFQWWVSHCFVGGFFLKFQRNSCYGPEFSSMEWEYKPLALFVFFWWQENDFNIYVGIFFSMRYCFKSQSYVDSPARKIQEQGNVQKTLSGWSFCSSSVILSIISMPLLKNSCGTFFTNFVHELASGKKSFSKIFSLYACNGKII